MLLASTPYFYSAKVTIECETPLSIKADDSDFTFDSLLVRDINGYPTIPGTTIAGVLRSVAQQCECDHSQLFGTAGDQNAVSQIQTSFGFIHTSDNQPLLGLNRQAIESKNEVDLLLKNLTPILRDQVALNEFGAATDGAKMDRTAVPKGTRFSFELNWASGDEDSEKRDGQWHKILAWLEHPNFRLGGLTQRGFGKTKVIEIRHAFYNMQEKSDLQGWMNNRANAFNAQNGVVFGQQTLETNDFIDFELQLEAEDFWRIGSGHKAIGSNFDKEPDIKPYTETVIDWTGHQAKPVNQQVVIPASGIKGALRHRTLFHFRRLLNDFSDGTTTTAQNANVELKNLFGDVQDGAGSKGALAGALMLDDIYLAETPQTQIMMHNKIDRFTGGTIDGALFSEQLLYGSGFSLKGKIQTRKGAHKIAQSAELLEAFKLALTDLAEGRLALGGGTTKGHGYFNATTFSIEALERAITEAKV